MKKVFTILFLAVSSSMIFTACSSDDDGADTSGDLVGKWEFFQEGTIINGQEQLVPYEHEEGCSKDNLEFLAGGVFKTNFYYNDDEENPCELDSETGTWTKNGNTISVSSFGESSSVQVLILNATTLKVRYQEGSDVYIDVMRRASN